MTFIKIFIFIFCSSIFFTCLGTEYNYTNYYLINTILSSFVIITSILVWKKKVSLEISMIDLIIPILLIFSFLQHFFKGDSIFFTTSFISLFIYSLIFTIGRNLFKYNIEFATKIFLYNILSLTIIFYIIFLLTSLQIGDISFIIAKLFGSSGILSIFLSISYSISLFLFIKTKSISRKIIFLSICIINFFLIFYFNSRTAFLVIFFFTLYQFFISNKKIPKWFLPVFCTITIYGISFYKQSSTDGRILIWKLSLNIIKDNFLLGTGWKTFPTVYPLYQAEYFNSGKMSLNEILLSNNTLFAFNEFLQIFCELGIIGILIFLYVFIRIIIKKNHTLCPIKYIVLILLFSSLFYYILYNTLLFTITLLALTIFFTNEKPIMTIGKFYSKSFIIYCLSVTCISFSIYFHKKYTSIKFFEKDIENNYFHNLYIYNKYLQDNPLFLLVYAKKLYLTKNYTGALNKIKIINKYATLYESKILEADCNINTNKNYSAEKLYKQAISICPNRFLGRHKLLTFYINNKDSEKALKIAQEIINLPEKIPSSATLAIKLEAKNFLNSKN